MHAELPALIQAWAGQLRCSMQLTDIHEGIRSVRFACLLWLMVSAFVSPGMPAPNQQNQQLLGAPPFSLMACMLKAAVLPESSCKAAKQVQGLHFDLEARDLCACCFRQPGVNLSHQSLHTCDPWSLAPCDHHSMPAGVLCRCSRLALPCARAVQRLKLHSQLPAGRLPRVSSSCRHTPEVHVLIVWLSDIAP
jgi:hypothetical protein